jgi:hypothetical protein
MPDLLEHQVNQCTASKATPNLKALCPNFGWLPIERIKKMTQTTAQFAQTAARCHFCKNTTVPGGLPLMLTGGMKTLLLMLSSWMLLPMMTAFLDNPVAPWPRFMLESKAPNSLRLQCEK